VTSALGLPGKWYLSENLKNGIADAALQTRIRLRAYELYEARGRADGHALEDWLRAERAVLEALQSSP
jgi:hypothetical protein